MKERIGYIDIAKGIGIILVMISHFTRLPYLLTNGYIQFFFILSGLTLSNISIKKKAKRLLIPTLFYGFLSVVLAYFLPGHSYDMRDGIIGMGGGDLQQISIDK